LIVLVLVALFARRCY